MNVYDRIMQGLSEAIGYNEGKIKARTNCITKVKKCNSRKSRPA